MMLVPFISQITTSPEEEFRHRMPALPSLLKSPSPTMLQVLGAPAVKSPPLRLDEILDYLDRWEIAGRDVGRCAPQAVVTVREHPDVHTRASQRTNEIGCDNCDDAVAEPRRIAPGPSGRSARRPLPLRVTV
jgi:hypothetical protein